jgi:hypothetical protein
MPVSHYLVRRNPVRRRGTSQLHANANNAVTLFRFAWCF